MIRWCEENWKCYNSKFVTHYSRLHDLWRITNSARLQWNSYMDYSQQANLHHTQTGTVWTINDFNSYLWINSWMVSKFRFCNFSPNFIPSGNEEHKKCICLILGVWVKKKPQGPLNTAKLKWGHSNYRYHQKTQNKLKIKRAFLIFQLYTLRKLNQGDVADPRAPLGNKF